MEIVKIVKSNKNLLNLLKNIGINNSLILLKNN